MKNHKKWYAATVPNKITVDLSGVFSCSLGHALRSTKMAATALAAAKPPHRNGQENKHKGATARNGVSE